MFEVTVGDCAKEIVSRHKAALDGGREGVAPEVPLPGVVEVHSAHANLGGVGASEEAWVLRNDLFKEGRAVLEAGGKASEGVDVEPKVAVDAHPLPLGFLQSQLEGAEEAGKARGGHRDEPKLPQDLLPALVRDPGGVGELVEELGQLDLAVWGEFDGLADGVE